MLRNILLGVIVMAAAPAFGQAEPTTQPETIRVVVLDFLGPEGDGAAMADSLRLKLARQDGWDVVDPITTQRLLAVTRAHLPPRGDPRPLLKAADASMIVWGQVTRSGAAVTVGITTASPPDQAVSTLYTDTTERWRAVIAGKIVTDITGRPLWAPPELDAEPEPAAEEFGPALNPGADFEDPASGWDAPDNVAVFYEPSPDGHGGVLRVKTDLKRDPYLKYRQALQNGQADAANPPTIKEDRSFTSLAGVEGVHVRSVWIKATPGQRYWLTADIQGQANETFFPRIFVKGFLDDYDAANGLHGQSMRERGLTPRSFAARPVNERKAIIAEDVAQHPERYRRECYRWYLACRVTGDGWQHFAEPFPPRGGLPDNVQWLRIDIYCYWPPGEYVIDNVGLHADPRQTAPLPEEQPRTPGVTRQPKDRHDH